MKPPEQVAREIARRIRKDVELSVSTFTQRPLDLDWERWIAAALIANRREAIEEAAKVAEDCGKTYGDNLAIDSFERSRRTGIRWCGEWAANRIRALAKLGGGA
jgi:hypothetical protein